MNQDEGKLKSRVVAAAEAAMAKSKVASSIDVLLALGWLPWARLEEWRRGQLPCLEQGLSVNPQKLSSALRTFGDWAKARGAKPSETEYVARTRDRHPLRFSASGEEAVERMYRTHWLSPELSPAKRERLEEKQSRFPDLVVISPLRDWNCTECGGTGDLLFMEGDGPLCLACADLDHLVFLPSGDATLSRRAKKASQLSAVVVRFSRSRKRYERQGILIEEAALERAEEECLADEDARARRRARDEGRREQEDREFQGRLVRELARLFPGCSRERAEAIARHAGARGSGRVGRSAAGRALDEEALTLAAVASIRHDDTPYDELLMSGLARGEARERVWPEVERILESWRNAPHRLTR